MKLLYFFFFCGSFLPSWIRIRIQQLKLMRIRIRNPAFLHCFEKNRIYTPQEPSKFHWKIYEKGEGKEHLMHDSGNVETTTHLHPYTLYGHNICLYCLTSASASNPNLAAHAWYVTPAILEATQWSASCTNCLTDYLSCGFT
jgi:hypothetical protein